MQSQFLRLLSHELRTPLTGIRGYGELLSRAGPLTAQQQHMLTMLNSCAHRLDSLIDDLLLLASIEAGMYGLVVEDLDVGTVCEQAVRRHTAHARPDEPRLVTVPPAGPCVVQADPRQLEHLLAALLNHAAGFFAARDELLVSTAPAETAAGEGVCVAVAVTEPGPPADPAELVGLGLAVVRAVAEQHGGTVSVDDTAIRVVLPRRPRAGERLRVVQRPRVHRTA